MTVTDEVTNVHVLLSDFRIDQHQGRAHRSLVCCCSALVLEEVLRACGCCSCVPVTIVGSDFLGFEGLVHHLQCFCPPLCLLFYHHSDTVMVFICFVLLFTLTLLMCACYRVHFNKTHVFTMWSGEGFGLGLVT